MKRIKYILASCLLSSLFIGCQDAPKYSYQPDMPTSYAPKVYLDLPAMKKGVNAINSLVVWEATDLVLDSYEKIDQKVRLTTTLSKDVKVTAKIANEEIEAFNKKHSTSYIAAPEGLLETSLQTTIKAGESISEGTVKVEVKDFDLFKTLDSPILVPIKLTAEGADVSSNLGHTYWIVNKMVYTDFWYIKDRETPLVGTPIRNYSDYESVTGPDSPYDGWGIKNAFNTNNYNGYLASGNFEMTLVLKEPKVIRSLEIGFYGTDYFPEGVKMECKQNGEWKTIFDESENLPKSYLWRMRFAAIRDVKEVRFSFSETESTVITQLRLYVD